MSPFIRPAAPPMVLPPKAVPVREEPDLPVWEEETSVSSSQTDSQYDVPYTPLTLGGIGLLVLVMLVRRLLKR